MTGSIFRCLTLALIGIIYSGLAIAADKGGPVPMPVPEPIRATEHTWDGPYFGVHLGGGVDGDNEFVGGLQLGHNWQRGSVIFGAEGDLSFSDETFGSIRGRLGLGNAYWMAYGTAGLVISEDDEGLVAGGGLEYRVSDRTSIGAEALYYDVDDDFTVIRARLSWRFGAGRSY